MPRKSTSLSLDADLIARATAVGANISRAAEAGVEQDVRRVEAERWKDDITRACDLLMTGY
ncbi:MAG: type II toxin-antitoxin system CcdA family antitoxin [Marivita sp.]|uniref:type II toxin-antitoxin system CcdA family antitoxin n=1 Tax=Marivita sp. TaxID=2003365 RepID=UPI003EF9041F